MAGRGEMHQHLIGWDCELFLDYKVWGVAVVWLWAIKGVATQEVLVGKLSSSPMLSFACGCGD